MKDNQQTLTAWQLWLGGALLAALLQFSHMTPALATEAVMYKSPGCECCTGWADSMHKAGFTVIEKRVDDMDAIKAQYGVPENLSSCHTAIVGGYVIEGHVPAADVQRLLREKPQGVVGLAAPGMPVNAPGMQEGNMPPKDYDVLAFDKDGHVTVFSHY
jgi:hypothetical protein